MLFRTFIRILTSLIRDFCTSDRNFASTFFQIPPHDGHPWSWLVVGHCDYNPHNRLSLSRYMPCPAYKNWRPSLQNSLFISIIFPFGAVRSIRDDIVVSILYKYHISPFYYVSLSCEYYACRSFISIIFPQYKDATQDDVAMSVDPL